MVSGSFSPWDAGPRCIQDDEHRAPLMTCSDVTIEVRDDLRIVTGRRITACSCLILSRASWWLRAASCNQTLFSSRICTRQDGPPP